MEEIKRGRYRHFKGNEYEVLAIATHSENIRANGDLSCTVRHTQPLGPPGFDVERDGYA